MWKLTTKIKNFIYNIKRGIINLIKWFPVIWKDRDYDYEFVYDLLIKKFDNMEKFYNGDKALSADSKEVAEEIKYAKDLLHKIKTHDYFEEAFDDTSASIRKAYENCEKDLQTVFLHIAKNIEKWWVKHFI